MLSHPYRREATIPAEPDDASSTKKYESSVDGSAASELGAVALSKVQFSASVSIFEYHATYGVRPHLAEECETGGAYWAS